MTLHLIPAEELDLHEHHADCPCNPQVVVADYEKDGLTERQNAFAHHLFSPLDQEFYLKAVEVLD